MKPPTSFPEGTLKLVEMDGPSVSIVHAELPTSSRNRMKIQEMARDLMMLNTKQDLRIVENNAY